MTVMPGDGQAKGKDRWYLIDEWCALPEDEALLLWLYALKRLI
jgi:hypothetical protein